MADEDFSGIEAQGSAAKDSNDGKTENSFGFITADHCPYGPGPLRDAWLRGFGAEEASDEAVDERIAEGEGRSEADAEHSAAVDRRTTAAAQVPGSIVPPDPANSAPAVAAPPAPTAAAATPPSFPATAQEASGEASMTPGAENVIATDEDAVRHAENVAAAQNGDTPPLAPAQGQIQPGDAAADGTAPKDEAPARDPDGNPPSNTTPGSEIPVDARTAPADDASHLM